MRAGLKCSSTMESTSSERIKLALKVLCWRYNGTAPATDPEIGRLKSYVKRDVPGMNAMEIAAAVISQELAKRKARGNSAG